MLSYGSQEAKVYPSGRETKFFFVPSCMERHHASPAAWWWEWEVEKPEWFRQSRVTAKTRGRCGGCLWDSVVFGLFAFKLGLPEGAGIDKNYLYSWMGLPCREIGQCNFSTGFLLHSISEEQPLPALSWRLGLLEWGVRVLGAHRGPRTQGAAGEAAKGDWQTRSFLTDVILWRRLIRGSDRKQLEDGLLCLG